MTKHSKFSKLPAYCLVADEIYPFNIYIKRTSCSVLWKKEQIELNSSDINLLKELKIEYVYMRSSESNKYLEYAEQNIKKVMLNNDIPVGFKSSLMNKLIENIIEDIFIYPSFKRCVNRIENIVNPLIELLLSEKGVNDIRCLIDTGDIVFSYAPHSARTCYYAVALGGTFFEIHNERLFQLCLGAILHDVGQMLVSPHVREKFNKYTDNERIEMQRHPNYSADFIRKLELYKFDNKILTAIKSHHELGDKTGYPNQASLFKLSIESQILAVTHTFDSYTMEKTHRRAKEPFEVIKYMLTHKNKYPEEVVRQFVKLLGELET